MNAPLDAPTPDALTGTWVDRLPAGWRPYARLARFDRPIGTWLLFWPCGWGLALAGGLPREAYLLLLFAIGSFAMRGAGCVYNDIVDRDLDARVERTRDRPLAAGRISVRAAWNWLFALSLIGFLVLIQLSPWAQVVALGSLALVAAYPFMKRVTWWPQAWLGLTFNWGVLVAWVAAERHPEPAMLLLYGAGVAWTLGYDTIYALQDIEDDALAGIKSSARRLGARVRGGVAGFYAATITLMGAAVWLVRPDPIALLALLPFAAHLGWQAWRMHEGDASLALTLFRSNRMAGLLAFAGLLVVGMA